ncbi:MAG TPA: WecB/TagA/CpsF family glycosyltransferase [Phycisphaerae bacterium]|nr:WecB/TagA/CpsF family glycosyltransferase [Phycisphaerae bacterium]
MMVTGYGSKLWERRDILGVKFDLIDYETVLTSIQQWRQAGERKYVTFANPHSVMLCQRDPAMRLATEGAGLTLPDGVGIILAAKLLRYPQRGRVAGPTLLLRLCDWGRQHGYRHYFYGGGPGVAESLASRLRDKFPGLQVAGTYSPPFRPLTEEEDAALIEKINSARPDIVWVGLGAPKQEKWMAEHVGRVQATAMIGVGAAFDFHSGNARWAPSWIRRLGLEWAFRLACEPRRMWPRMVDNVRFLLSVAAQRTTHDPKGS